MSQMPDWQTKTDEELVKLTLQNQEVFGALIKRYESRLIQYIRRISNCRTDEAEDVLQEAFIKAYQNLNAFDPKQKFSSWMYRIARNEVISTYRKLQARAEGRTEYVDDDVLRTFASELDIKQEFEAKELHANICKVLDAMDVKYREVLVLKYLEEKDYKEISFILKKPMGTIATLLNRAKKRFLQTAREKGIEFVNI